MILHRVSGDEQTRCDIGGGVPSDHLAADVPLARCKTVRCEQQTQQMITVHRLDGDCDLSFLAADQQAGLEHCPVTTCIAQPGTKTA
jgi:hypothetical protein